MISSPSALIDPKSAFIRKMEGKGEEFVGGGSSHLAELSLRDSSVIFLPNSRGRSRAA